MIYGTSQGQSQETEEGEFLNRKYTYKARPRLSEHTQLLQKVQDQQIVPGSTRPGGFVTWMSPRGFLPASVELCYGDDPHIRYCCMAVLGLTGGWFGCSGL